MNRSNVALAGPTESSVMGHHVYGLQTAIGFPGVGILYYQLRQRTNVDFRSGRREVGVRSLFFRGLCAVQLEITRFYRARKFARGNISETPSGRYGYPAVSMSMRNFVEFAAGWKWGQAVRCLRRKTWSRIKLRSTGGPSVSNAQPSGHLQG